MLGFNYKPGIKFPVCYAHTHTNYMYYTINTCHSYVTKSNKVFWVHSWVASNISFPSKLIFGMQLVIFLSLVSFQWRHRPVAWKGSILWPIHWDLIPPIALYNFWCTPCIAAALYNVLQESHFTFHVRWTIWTDMITTFLTLSCIPLLDSAGKL